MTTLFLAVAVFILILVFGKRTERTNNSSFDDSPISLSSQIDGTFEHEKNNY